MYQGFIVIFIADRPIGILFSQTYAHGIKAGFNTYSLYSFEGCPFYTYDSNIEAYP